jgi:hypothetical protein
VLTICGALTARDRGLCDESTQAKLLGHMSKVTGRGKYLGPHSYGALAWGVGHKEGSLPGSQYLEMGEGFDASRIRRLVKIAADVPAFNRLVRGVLPGWRTLDWRDVAYLFCMNGGTLGIATETTTPTGQRRSHVTGSERLWLALERIAVDMRHLCCLHTHACDTRTHLACDLHSRVATAGEAKRTRRVEARRGGGGGSPRGGRSPDAAVAPDAREEEACGEPHDAYSHLHLPKETISGQGRVELTGVLSTIVLRTVPLRPDCIQRTTLAPNRRALHNAMMTHTCPCTGPMQG